MFLFLTFTKYIFLFFSGMMRTTTGSTRTKKLREKTDYYNFIFSLKSIFLCSMVYLKRSRATNKGKTA